MIQIVGCIYIFLPIMVKLMAPYGIMFSALKADTKRCAPNLTMCMVLCGQTGESMVIQNSYG